MPEEVQHAHGMFGPPIDVPADADDHALQVVAGVAEHVDDRSARELDHGIVRAG